jgi:hypothetical protein
MTITIQQALGMTDEDVHELQTSLDACCGKIDEPGLQIEWYGACPVQGEGTVDGHPCYYRARCGSQLEVYAIDDLATQRPPIWTSEEMDGDGWDTADVTATFIRQAVTAWRASLPESTK